MSPCGQPCGESGVGQVGLANESTDIAVDWLVSFSCSIVALNFGFLIFFILKSDVNSTRASSARLLKNTMRAGYEHTGSILERGGLRIYRIRLNTVPRCGIVSLCHRYWHIDIWSKTPNTFYS